MEDDEDEILFGGGFGSSSVVPANLSLSSPRHHQDAQDKGAPFGQDATDEHRQTTNMLEAVSLESAPLAGNQNRRNESIGMGMPITMGVMPGTTNVGMGMPGTTTEIKLDMPGTTTEGNTSLTFQSSSPNSSAAPLLQVTIDGVRTQGEGMRAFTVYRVVAKTTCLDLLRAPEVAVERRFREFLWLEQQLASNHLGVIVPPCPEKHAIGRLDQELVAVRRQQLERMLQNIASHPLLCKDADFRRFLESERLPEEMQEAEKRNKPVAGSSFLARLTDAVLPSSSPAAAASAAVSASFARIPEEDDGEEYFDGKREQLIVMEGQLRHVAKAVETVVRQRQELGNSYALFSECVLSVGGTEIHRGLEKTFRALGESLKQNQLVVQEQSSTDVAYLANTVDEYIRWMGAIKVAFGGRLKAYQMHKTTQQNTIKNRIALEKTKLGTASKAKSEKAQQLERDILEGERMTEETRQEYVVVTERLRTELERFQHQKVVKFVEAMQAFLRETVAAQKKSMALWETCCHELELAAMASATTTTSSNTANPTN